MSHSAAPQLAWNVKSTFRSYVELAGGSISVQGSAIEQPDSFTFDYEGDEGDPDVDVLRFEGSVRFSAHSGALDLLVRDPWIHREGTSTRLSIAGTEATRTAGGRLFLAELVSVEPTGRRDAIEGIGVPTVLLAEGAVAFDFRYRAGTELAPVSYLLPASPLVNQHCIAGRRSPWTITRSSD